MLLFSTMLPINGRMTKDKFIELLIDWNQKSPHEENKIPGIRDEWSGEHNIRFGDKDLWMDIQEYRNQNIIASRYEKTDEDGIVWDSDFVMNFSEMKLAIQLQRSYLPDSWVVDNRFRPPHLIETLIKEGYVSDDNGLSIEMHPYVIEDDEIDFLADIITEKRSFNLPVVFVSKRFGDDESYVNTESLANRLRGIAHVIEQRDNGQTNQIRQLCDDRNEYNGAIGVYYQTSYPRYRRFISHTGEPNDRALFENIIRNVIQHVRMQRIPDMYTYQGVTNALLKDRLESREKQRREAESDSRDYKELFEIACKDIDDLTMQVNNLTRERDAFQSDNLRIITNNTGTDRNPVLYHGNEADVYDDEIKEMILDAVSDALKNVSSEDRSRRRDVLLDILNSNDYQNISKKRHNKVKSLLRGYTHMSKSLRRDLKELNIEITDENKHYKLKYNNDDRYLTTLSKTASDNRTGMNSANTIINTMM